MNLNPALVLPQDPAVLTPPTLPAAATIYPVSAITFVYSTGDTVESITPPWDGPHQLTLISVNGDVTYDGAGVGAAVTVPENTAGIFSYDPRTNKYWGLAVSSGGSSLPLQVAADGDPVLLNADGNIIQYVQNGNIATPVYIGDTSIGEVFFNIGRRSAFYDSINVDVFSDGIAASLTTDLGVPNADLTWTATNVGQEGNNFQVTYVDDGAFSVVYIAPLLTINIELGVTIADDIYTADLSGVPFRPVYAPGSDGSGLVTELAPTNLSGGLAALNVTGPSSLDNGAITTSGGGLMYTTNAYQAGPVGGSILKVSGDDPGNPALLVAIGEATDVSLSISAQGAGTINLNSPVVIANGAVGGTFTAITSITVVNGIITAISGT